MESSYCQGSGHVLHDPVWDVKQSNNRIYLTSITICLEFIYETGGS